jgi:hypothetical protein
VVATPARGRPGRLAILTIVLVGAFAFLAPHPARADQAPVGLGTADSFAVLAGSGITNTGPTTITGDVGTFPTPSETGFGSVTLHGTNHEGDAVTQGAKNDLVTAYNDASLREPVTNLPVELGGSTLKAGVYSSGTFGLTGTLTLDAEGRPDAEFIFKAGSTLITASYSRVLLVNGADPCHVVWRVASSATFNTGTRFVGDVLAYTSISAKTSATFQGRLLARNGAVTLDTNTITRARCAAPVSGGGTTSTTAATTPTTAGTTPTTSAATAPSPSPPSSGDLTPAAVPALTPGTPTATPGTPTAAPGSPTAAPGTPFSDTPSRGTPTRTPGTPSSGPPSTPSGPPFMAFTGIEIAGLVAMALALLAIGTVTIVAARRRRGLQLT